MDLYRAYGNMQGEIYSICKELFIPCFLEVQTKHNGRPDCVIIVNGKKIIIECKKQWVRPKATTKQLKLYYKLNIPIILAKESNNLFHLILCAYDQKLEHGVYVFDAHVLKKLKSKLYYLSN